VLAIFVRGLTLINASFTLISLFPKSFWSFDKALELIGRRVSPLGMITRAAILPQTWEFRLVDRNVQLERSRLGLGRSGDNLRHDCPETRYAALIREAKRRGKNGGRWPLRHPFLRQLSQRGLSGFG